MIFPKESSPQTVKRTLAPEELAAAFTTGIIIALTPEKV
jgi:hypothetical protein